LKSVCLPSAVSSYEPVRTASRRSAPQLEAGGTARAYLDCDGRLVVFISHINHLRLGRELVVVAHGG
jgi:broad specificity phosphatase PhoE